MNDAQSERYRRLIGILNAHAPTVIDEVVELVARIVEGALTASHESTLAMLRAHAEERTP